MIQGSWEFCSNHLQCRGLFHFPLTPSEGGPGPLLSSPHSFRESQSRPHFLYFSDDYNYRHGLRSGTSSKPPTKLPKLYCIYSSCDLSDSFVCSHNVYLINIEMVTSEKNNACLNIMSKRQFKQQNIF